jgi:hypothetical protein
MQSQEELDQALERWGEQLLRPGLRRYGTPGRDPSSARPAPLSGAAIRAGLRAIVLRNPEVMVKVTGGGRGMAAIKAHMSYISRKGELALENQDGLKLQGREELALLAEEWKYGGGLIPEVSHRREALHVMFSMPPGADAQAVYNASRAFAREEFAAHKCAMVLHDPSTDPDSHRPHVHMIVRAQGRDGQRLQPKKADLARWRQEFADRLMERGVAASATRRQTRGVVQGARKLRDYHRGIGSKDSPNQPGIAAQRTEHEVLTAWQHVAEALRNSSNIEDRDLGRQVANFKGSMQTVARAVSQWRRRRKEIDRETDRQEQRLREQGMNPEPSRNR